MGKRRTILRASKKKDRNVGNRNLTKRSKRSKRTKRTKKTKRTKGTKGTKRTKRTKLRRINRNKKTTAGMLKKISEAGAFSREKLSEAGVFSRELKREFDRGQFKGLTGPQKEELDKLHAILNTRFKNNYETKSKLDGIQLLNKKLDKREIRELRKRLRKRIGSKESSEIMIGDGEGGSLMINPDLLYSDEDSKLNLSEGIPPSKNSLKL